MKRRRRYRFKCSPYVVHRNATEALSTNLSKIDGQLRDFSTLLRELFSDENFLTLLRAEGLITIPKWLHDQLK